DLSGADLDFSCLTLWCDSLTVRTDRRLRVQLCFHFLRWIKNADNADADELELLAKLRGYANEFHKQEVERLEEEGGIGADSPTPAARGISTEQLFITPPATSPHGGM